MELHSTPPEEPAAPLGLAKTWNRRRRLTLGLTAVALVAGGGVAIAAGSPDGSPDGGPDGSAVTTKPANPGQPAGDPAGKPTFRGGVLHSESVFSDGKGGYVTELTQVGKIESVDDNNLTVVSDDGFKQAWKRTTDTAVGGAKWDVTKNDDGSWTVRRSDATALATGDQVLVIGTVSDGVATAKRIASKPDGKGDLPPGMLKGLGDGPRMKQRMGGGPGSMEGGQGFMGGPGAVEGGQSSMGGPGSMNGAPGQMGAPGGKVRQFEFRTGPDGEGPSMVSPANPEAPSAPMPAAPAPAEPSAAYSAGSVSFT